MSSPFLGTIPGDIKQLTKPAFTHCLVQKEGELCQKFHKERLWWLIFIIILLSIIYGIVTCLTGMYVWSFLRTIYWGGKTKPEWRSAILEIKRRKEVNPIEDGIFLSLFPGSPDRNCYLSLLPSMMNDASETQVIRCSLLSIK